MSVPVIIPAVGESITSGVLSSWHKQSGDQVAVGDLLFVLDTDKVSSEVTALEAGVLTIKVPEGNEVKIGETVGEIEVGAAATCKSRENKSGEKG